MKTNRLKLMLGLVIAALMMLPLLVLAQPTNLIGGASDTSSVTGSPYTDAGAIIAGLLLVGAIFKHAFPNFPNRFIPLLTFGLGALGYMLMTGASWGDGKAWFNAVMVAATATGLHSGVKNTFQDQAAVNAKNAVGLFVVLGLLSLGLVGCGTTPAPQGGIGIQTSPTGTNITGQLVWQPQSNIVVNATGAIDPLTGQYSGGISVVFKDAPPAYVVAELSAAHAVDVTTRVAGKPPGIAAIWVLPKTGTRDPAQGRALAAAKSVGAVTHLVQ